MTTVPFDTGIPVQPMGHANAREPLPPLVRFGGVLGFVALALTALLAPAWAIDGRAVLELNAAAGDEYLRVVHKVVPAVQLYLGGAGTALIVVGRAMAGRRPRLGHLLATVLNLAAMGVAVHQMLAATPTRPAAQPMGHVSDHM